MEGKGIIEKTGGIKLCDLGLSVRLFRCLKREGFSTLTEIMQTPTDQFIRIRNLGRTSEKELLDLIAFVDTRDKLFLITTNATFVTADFQKCLASINGDYIFLADEMHHLISDLMRRSLPQNAKYRLGLSATLMTKYSSANMEDLKSYFGGIVYEYSMKEAIKTNCLTKYYYYPTYVELTEDEKEEYYEISRKISKAVAIAGGDLDDDNVSLKGLLSQRARILASASNKLEKLREMIADFKDKSNLIVYCGDKIESDGK